MIRDITMIISVLISVVSVGFGVYQGIESSNAKAFAYEQAYRVLNIVQNANISAFQKATIADAALDALATPAPVIDLSRSSADTGSTNQACPAARKDACTKLASDLASANTACAKKDQAACSSADDLHRQIIGQDCIACFTK